MRKLLFSIIFIALSLSANETVDTKLIKNVVSSIKAPNKGSEAYNKFIMSQLKEKLPDLYQKLSSALDESKKLQQSKDVIYLFASSSVPDDAIRNFIMIGSVLNYHFNTEVFIVFQGLTNNEFENRMIEISDGFMQYENSELYYSNFNRIFDPYIFKELSLKNAPAIGYAQHSGNPYPSDSDLMYLVRGDIPLVEFFGLIAEKNENFKPYFELLKNY